MNVTDIETKARGDLATHEEYNAIVKAICDLLSSSSLFTQLTTTEYNALSVKEQRFYICLDDDGALEYIYHGVTLIAKRGANNSATGFAYSFPITF